MELCIVRVSNYWVRACGLLTHPGIDLRAQAGKGRRLTLTIANRIWHACGIGAARYLRGWQKSRKRCPRTVATTMCTCTTRQPHWTSSLDSPWHTGLPDVMRPPGSHLIWACHWASDCPPWGCGVLSGGRDLFTPVNGCKYVNVAVNGREYVNTRTDVDM